MTELVKYQGLVPDYKAFDAGIEELPLIFPYLTIGQKDELSGKIVSSTGETFDKKIACIVKITTARVMWPKPFSPDSDPLCRSKDGMKPDIDLFLSGKAEGRPPAEYCSECQFAQTGTEDSWKRPACDSQIVVWGIDDGFMPFVLNLSGMSLSTKCQTKGFLSVKQFISSVRLRRQPLYLFKTEIIIGKAKNEKGGSYVALFKILGNFTQDELEEMADSIRGISQAKTEQIQDGEPE